jgi:hypothetical protein
MSEQEPAPTGALEYLIPVQYDGVANTLSILHPSLSLRPGDRVIWVFEGVPSSWSPWIQFKTDAGDGQGTFLGPFEILTQLEGGFWGATRQDSALLAASYTYRACIQKGLDSQWDSDVAFLCSPGATLELVQDLRLLPVTFNVAATAQQVAPGVGELVVTPEMHFLESGQAVIWDFQEALSSLGDPDLWRPRVNFLRYEGYGTVVNQLLGPFTCLAYEAAKITGLGNTAVAGAYHFGVSISAVSHGEAIWVSSGDPVIDNRGTVIDPVSG